MYISQDGTSIPQDAIIWDAGWQNQEVRNEWAETAWQELTALNKTLDREYYDAVNRYQLS